MWTAAIKVKNGEPASPSVADRAGAVIGHVVHRVAAEAKPVIHVRQVRRSRARNALHPKLADELLQQRLPTCGRWPASRRPNLLGL